jgi:putative ABC transport system permease protein
MAYLVSRRTPELAIRMAPGADRRSVVAMVVLEGMRTVAIGGVAGLLLALAAGRLMSHLLFGVGWHAFVTFAAVSALLAAVAFAACYLPARRAKRIDPIRALRCE